MQYFKLHSLERISLGLELNHHGVPLSSRQANASSQAQAKEDYGPNVSVFVGIGTGLGVAGLCTMMLIGGLRKFKEAPEEEPLQSREEPP